MSRKISVVNHLTPDGVTQAPARPDEDPRGGFAHGGWAIPRNDPAMAEEIGKGMGHQVRRVANPVRAASVGELVPACSSRPTSSRSVS
jgi:hypothetical protein